MPDSDKIQEFLDKLKPCIEKGELDACVDEAARLAEEMGISAVNILDLSMKTGKSGGYAFAYVLALMAAQGLEEMDKASAYSNVGLAAKYLGKIQKTEKFYKKAIDIYPKYARAHNNYGNLLKELKRYEEAKEHYNKAIELNPEYAVAYSSYAILLYEMKKYVEAEKHFNKAIELNPEDAEAHNNYAVLLVKLKRYNEAEEYFNKTIELKPKYAEAHNNYAVLLFNLKRYNEAEEYYNKAIELRPKYAEAHNNYAALLVKLKRYNEAEEYYNKAIELNPESAETYYNYSILFKELRRYEKAAEQSQKAIKANPEHALAHNNYANILYELKRYVEAYEHYNKAIELKPNNPETQANYGLLLVELDRRNQALERIEMASQLFKEVGRITESHLIKGWFYGRYSEKNFKRRKFPESGEDAGKAGDEFLKAAETADTDLKDYFSQQGNILKAKSFVRKVPKKSWRRKIPIIGKKSDISNIINNLKEAASYYERAAQCPIEDEQNVCNACHISITVFSETLSVMDAFINKRNAEINKKEWDKSLESARLIYEERKMKNGVALVDTLKQLIKCVDEIAVHKENGLGFQKDKCGKCFGKLADVSEKLDGALNVLAEHSIEAIRDYAKKQGMGGFDFDEPKKSIWNNWLVRGGIFIVATIFLNLLSSKLYDLNILATIWNHLKSLIS